MEQTATSLHTPFAGGRYGGGGFEDQALTLAQYYNLPVISMRNALFTWLASNVTDAWDFMRDLTTDGLHPQPPLQVRHFPTHRYQETTLLML